jgi:modulator of FtsH protease HflK
MHKTRKPGSVEELMERITHFRVPRGRPTAGQSKLAGGAVLAVFLLVSGMTAFYQVDAEEAGVVTRMGKHVRTVDPGLRMKAPWGIERIHRVPVQRQLKIEFGFRTDDRRTDQARFLPVQEESLMLTGDLNAVNVEFSIQLRASDPYAYLFNVRDRDIALRALAEATMREVVGDRTVTEVLTVGRQEIEVTTRSQLNELVALYEMGITIDQVVLQDVTPPAPVRASWDEVNQAQQQRDRVINEAWAEYNRVIPRALGQAEEQILLARAYEVERLNRARGEAARFLSVYEEYRKAPRVTRARIYNEYIQGILSGVTEMYIFDEGTPSPHSVLPLNFPAPRAATASAASGGN